MAWSTPPDWTTGDLITQGKLQTITDNLNALKNHTYTKRVSIPPFPDNFNGAVAGSAAIWHYPTAGLGWSSVFVSGAAGAAFMRFSYPIENDWAGGDILLKAAMFTDVANTTTPKIYWASNPTNTASTWEHSNVNGNACALATNTKHFTIYTFTSDHIALEDVLYCAWSCHSASYGVHIPAVWLEYTAKVFP